ncbi:hypothetical protein Btru_076068 [Bulinus truncatus]|nr:hypothetical protein Btru_076068 [Bulinus truncatus]
MKRFYLTIVFTVWISATVVFSMTASDYGRFIYTIAGNFTTVLIVRPQAQSHSGPSGYESLRPILSIPALQGSGSSSVRFFYNQHSSGVKIPNLNNNGVIRVTNQNNRDAVLSHRNFRQIMKVPTSSEETFQNFFRNLPANAFQPNDEPCRHVFEYNIFKAAFRSRTQGCKISVEILFVCKQRHFTEFGGYNGVKGQFSFILTSNLTKRYAVPKSWNVTPC